MEGAAVLQLDKLLERRPNELSGGQRQRVALGRALVRHPKLFLMDEPHSNLDAALRGELRAELVRLHRKLGITTVYVTHDQIEALSMADRIAIMYEGRLQQVGAGQEVFDDPANQFVAGFLGAPRMNFIAGNLIEQDGQLALTFCDVAVPLPAGTRLRQSVALPMPVNVGIRPTDLTPAPQALGDPVLNGCVDFIEPMGAETFLTARCGDVKLIARVSGRTRHAVGESVSLRIDPAFLYAFATDTGSALIDRTSIFRHRVLV
jgi:ABC-type sugar transport system ATPase subunit